MPDKKLTGRIAADRIRMQSTPRSRWRWPVIDEMPPMFVAP
jgi:hypothetical protein